MQQDHKIIYNELEAKWESSKQKEIKNKLNNMPQQLTILFIVKVKQVTRYMVKSEEQEIREGFGSCIFGSYYTCAIYRLF